MFSDTVVEGNLERDDYQYSNLATSFNLSLNDHKKV